MIKTTFKDCKIIELPIIQSSRQGSITPIYNKIHVPFDIKRVYYLYDVPAGSERGGHAHKELEQLIVAASGSFNIVMNDDLEFIEIQGTGEEKSFSKEEFNGLLDLAEGGIKDLFKLQTEIIKNG